MSERRAEFARDGYLVVKGLRVEALTRLRARADELLERPPSGASMRFSAEKKRVLGKLPQLAERDATFRALAQLPQIVDILEELIGPALVFRDVLIVKPALDGAIFKNHQDIAYWDVSPAALVVSAWIALDDAPLASGCLEVVPGSHQALLEHRLLAGRHTLPAPITRALRRAASLTGTGDHPKTLRERWFASAKNFAFGAATRFLPALGELNDFHIDPARIPKRVALPVAAGDVIFFDSRLVHASGPNTSPRLRRAYIVSYMSVNCKVPRAPSNGFLPARSLVESDFFGPSLQ